jgi:hypothetical protein
MVSVLEADVPIKPITLDITIAVPTVLVLEAESPCKAPVPSRLNTVSPVRTSKSWLYESPSTSVSISLPSHSALTLPGPVNSTAASASVITFRPLSCVFEKAECQANSKSLKSEPIDDAAESVRMSAPTSSNDPDLSWEEPMRNATGIAFDRVACCCKVGMRDASVLTTPSMCVLRSSMDCTRSTRGRGEEAVPCSTDASLLNERALLDCEKKAGSTSSAFSVRPIHANKLRSLNTQNAKNSSDT